jgi:hypothetical protein
MANTLNTISKQLTIINKDLLNEAFWRDESQIATYCHNIIKYCNIESTLVRISFHNASTASVNLQPYSGTKIYSITLPVFPILNLSDNEKVKQIYLRSILLRHELGHVLYSDWGLIPKGDQQLHYFYNWAEDARIEHKIAKTFLGMRRAFRELDKIFFKNSKEEIENGDININNFSNYCQQVLKGYKFKNTPAVKVYSICLTDGKEILDFSEKRFNKIINEAYEAFIKMLPSIPELKANLQPQQEEEQGEESEENSNTEEESDNSSEESDSEEEGTEGDSKQSKESDEESEESEGSEQPELAPSSKGSQAPAEGPGDEEETELSETEQLLGDAIEDMKSIQDLANEIIATESPVTIDNFMEQYEFNEKDFRGALKVNLPYAAKYFRGLPKTNRKEGSAQYRRIIHEYNNVITDCVRFLKLKIQHRTYTRNLNFREEGLLDQSNLKEIVINKQSPRAFYQTINKIDPKSHIHIVIDISGSMQPEQIYLCMINSTILYEVCKRLDIPCSIMLFTSGCPGFTIKEEYAGKLSISQLKRVFCGDINHIQSNGTPLSALTGITGNNIHSDGVIPATLYFIKNINEQFAPAIEKMLGSFTSAYFQSNHYRHHRRGGNPFSSLSGGTPEFESVKQIFEEFKKLNKNILFILNDGAFADFLPEKVNQNIIRVQSVFSHYRVTMGDPSMAYTFDRILQYLNNIDANHSTIHSAIKSSQSGYMSSDTDKVAVTAESLMVVIEEMKQAIKMMKEYVSGDSLTFNPAIIRVQEKSTTVNIETTEYTKTGITSRFLSGFYNTIDYYIRNCEHQNNPDMVVYKKMIDKMRTAGWKVYGIGIRNDLGKRYIGKDKFIKISNAQDLIQTFAKQLRQVF